MDVTTDISPTLTKAAVVKTDAYHPNKTEWLVLAYHSVLIILCEET